MFVWVRLVSVCFKCVTSFCMLVYITSVLCCQFCWVWFFQQAYRAKRLAGKNVSEITYLVSSRTLNLTPSIHPTCTSVCVSVTPLITNKSVFSFLRTLTKWHARIRLPLLQHSIDISCRPGPQQPVCCCQPFLGQTDGLTPDSCIGPALHSMRAVPTIDLVAEGITSLSHIQHQRWLVCSSLSIPAYLRWNY